MKKGKLLAISLIALSILIGSAMAGLAAPPGEKPEGKPFQAIWAAIDDLKARVGSLETEVAAFWNKVKTVQAEIAALAVKVTNLENWKTTIETWKTEIKSWQTSVDSKIANLESEIGKLWDKLTSVQDEIAALWTKVTNLQEEIAELGAALAPDQLLAKIKQVAGHGSGLDADTVDGLHASQLMGWPPGSYCILRAGGYCPPGFSWGGICLDTEDVLNLDKVSGNTGDAGKGGCGASSIHFNLCCK